MAFGISFGKKGSTTTTNTTGTKDETMTGSQTQNTTSSNQTSQSGTSQTSSSQTGQQTNVQSGTQTQSGTETGKVTSTTQTLGSDIQAALSDSVKKLLGGSGSQATFDAINNSISVLNSFDANGYVKSAIDSARYSGEQALQEQQSAYDSAIGGTAATNSMAALLASRGRADLEAKIAQVGNDATASAADIVTKNLGAVTSGQSSLTAQAQALAETLKGASTTTDQTTLSSQIQQLLNQSTGQTASSQQASESQATQQQSLSLISELVNALTKQQTNTVATEASKSSTKQSGGGFSLAL